MKTSASAVCAATFLFALPTLAEDSSPRPKNALLERRLIVPDVIGLRIGSPVAGTMGIAAGLGGLVSYSYDDASTAGSASHVETFGLSPSLDVRAGRFTIGGTLRFTHLYARQDSPALDIRATNLSFQAVPRVGLLVPLAPHVTLWPRVGAGFLVGSTEQFGVVFPSQKSTVAGVIGEADALVVVDLGSRFFVSAGPALRFVWTTSEVPLGLEQKQASFQAGASVAMGVAF